MRLLNIGIIFASLATTALCQAQSTVSATLSEPRAARNTIDKASYIIGPGDEITIHVLDSQDILDKPMRVDPDGQISLPMIGRIEAANRSVATLESEITTRLKIYILDPQVSVNVTEYASQPVSVLGAVNAPGIYQLSGAKTIAEVIALAKGLSPDAGGTIRITRHDSAGSRSAVESISVEDFLASAAAAESIPVYAKDTITIPKAKLVYVIGDVRKPGPQTLGNRGTIGVLEAISGAEGVLPTGTPQRARLLRIKPGTSERKETRIDVKNIMAGRSQNVTLEPDDILVIPHNGPRAAELKAVDAMISLGTGALVYGR